MLINGGSLGHVSSVKSCLNTATLESHFSIVYKKKETQPKKYSSFRLSCSLFGPKPGTTAAKVTPKNNRSNFLLGDNLRQACCLQELTRIDYKKDFMGNKQTLESKQNLFWTMARWSKLQSTITTAEITFLQQ